jgi:hypothetical protein
MLQRYVSSENDLITFFDRFGPSTRSAYAYTKGSIKEYDARLRTKIANASYEDLDRMFRQASALDLREETSHQLALISAGTFRDEPSVTIPTRYIYDLLIERRSVHKPEAAARLYSIFIWNRYTRSAAGYILNDGYHDVLCKGGQWRISSMKERNPSPKYTHWTFRAEEPDGPDLYLRLGFEGHSITFSTCKLPDSTTYSALPMKEYVQLPQLPLIDGYYRPSSPSAETLDSFIFEARSKTATIFQATVAKKHSVKQGGIEWLLSLGVQKFRFIAVTAPGPEVTLDFPFPNEWRNGEVPIIPDKHVLVLESLEV